MQEKNLELTEEQYLEVMAMDAKLYACCTNKEQSEQMLRIMRNRKSMHESTKNEHTLSRISN